jgi:hypothetical protein
MVEDGNLSSYDSKTSVLASYNASTGVLTTNRVVYSYASNSTDRIYLSFSVYAVY